MTDDTAWSRADLLALRDNLFGAAAEQSDADTGTAEHQGNTVASEGGNPAPQPSDEHYNRDFLRRLFDDQYDAYQPQLPEE